MFIIGEIRSFAFGAHSPSFIDLAKQGWIPCDGRPISISNHGDLYKAIGTTWGAVVPGANFCVPNLFGTFLRGATLWQNETVDPEVSIRKPPRPNLAITGASGANVGSFQDCTYQSHGHVGGGKKEGGVAYNNGLALTAVAGGPRNANITIDANGGQETRPNNHYVMYMIYAGNNLPKETIDEIVSLYSPEN